jgi:hypothetical protein
MMLPAVHVPSHEKLTAGIHEFAIHYCCQQLAASFAALIQIKTGAASAAPGLATTSVD